MKTKPSIRLRQAFLILFCFLLPDVANAVPRTVTFFPNSARVTDVSRVAAQASGEGEFKVQMKLPSQAVPDSLVTRLDPVSGLKIEDQAWRQISRQDEARITELRRQLQQVKLERIGVFSEIQSLDAQIQFWQAQAKLKSKMTVDETATLAAHIGKSVKKDLQEKLALEPNLETLDKRIRELQEEITRIAGQKDTIWEVTLTLSGTPAQEADLTMTYTLNGCGWLPLYRLDAHPRDLLIRFTWDAEIWQSSGIDWNQVDTELATLQTPSTITPPDLPPWIIRPRPEIRLYKGRQNAEVLTAPMAAPHLSMDAQGAEPRETRQTTYAVWTLGKRTIPAGARHRLKIREENWQADFVHLLRPSMTSQAFIRATVKLPEGSEFPSGSASFLIDGAAIGKRSFAFAGQEGAFFFGIDPLVTARSVLLSRKSGEKGLIVDQQTQEWTWRMDLSNGGINTIQVQLEEPLPQSRDDRIKITFQPEPEASEKNTSEMIWRLQIPGGQKRSILNKIHLEAPKEIDLDLGWRR
jgi:uncharacterized protein (TIGR02231 family)